MPNIGSLIVELRTNTAKFVQGMDRAEQRAKKTSQVLGRLAGIAVGAAGVGGLGALVSRALDARTELALLSRQLVASTEELSELGFAATQNNIIFQNFALGSQRARRRIAEAAQGAGEAKDAIKELGLEAEELNKLTIGEQFNEFARAFSRVEDEADKVRLGFKLFDSEGVKLIRLFEDGEEGLRKFREEAKNFGVSISTDAAEGAAKLNEELGKLKAQSEGTANAVITALTPGMTLFAEGANDALSATKEFTNFMSSAFAPVFGASTLIVLKTKATLDSFSVSLSRAASSFSAAIRGNFGDAIGELGAIGGDVAAEFEEATLGFLDVMSERFDDINKGIEVAGKTTTTVVTDPLKEATDAMTAHVDAFQRERQRLVDEAERVFEQTRTPLERYESEVRGLQDLFREGNISFDTLTRGIEQQAEEFNQASGALDDYKDTLKSLNEDTEKVSQGAVQAAGNIANAFVDASFQGEKLRTVIRGLLKDIASLVARQLIIEPLASGISSAFSGLGNSNAQASGGTNITQNFDFKGANPATIQALRQEAKGIERRTIATIQNKQVRGQLPEFV